DLKSARVRLANVANEPRRVGSIRVLAGHFRNESRRSPKRSRYWMLPPFRRLHCSQSNWTFRSVLLPPLASGIIWSNSSRSREPHFEHRRVATQTFEGARGLKFEELH